MKTLFTFVFAFLFTAPIFCQDEWAPIGTVWYYRSFSVFSPPSLAIWTATGDTVLQGVSCTKIVRYDDIYMYKENEKVFIYNPQDSTFGLLYDFSVQQGGQWKIKVNDDLHWPFDSMTIEVDSIIDREVSGKTIKTQLVSLYNVQGQLMGTDSIFENIGSANSPYFFNDINPDIIYPEGGTRGLQCFETPGEDALNFYGQACLVSSDEERPKNNTLFSIGPNPATDHLHVAFINRQTSNAGTFGVFDISGKLVNSFAAAPSTSLLDIPLGGIPAGLYFLKYLENGVAVAVERFVVSK